MFPPRRKESFYHQQAGAQRMDESLSIKRSNVSSRSNMLTRTNLGSAPKKRPPRAMILWLLRKLAQSSIPSFSHFNHAKPVKQKDQKRKKKKRNSSQI